MPKRLQQTTKRELQVGDLFEGYYNTTALTEGAVWNDEYEQDAFDTYEGIVLGERWLPVLPRTKCYVVYIVQLDIVADYEVREMSTYIRRLSQEEMFTHYSEHVRKAGVKWQ